MAGNEVDTLAFDIEFALKRKLLSRALTTFFRRMPDEDLQLMCRCIADYLRQSNWRRGPPVQQGPLGSGLPKKGGPL